MHCPMTASQTSSKRYVHDRSYSETLRNQPCSLSQSASINLDHVVDILGQLKFGFDVLVLIILSRRSYSGLEICYSTSLPSVEITVYCSVLISTIWILLTAFLLFNDHTRVDNAINSTDDKYSTCESLVFPVAILCCCVKPIFTLYFWPQNQNSVKRADFVYQLIGWKLTCIVLLALWLVVKVHVFSGLSLFNNQHLCNNTQMEELVWISRQSKLSLFEWVSVYLWIDGAIKLLSGLCSKCSVFFSQ